MRSSTGSCRTKSDARIGTRPTVLLPETSSNLVMKILIVDGSKRRRLDLVSVLGELTNIVVQGAVGDVRTAMRAVADSNPDVVVTGTLLPDGDGTHLIERIRRLERGPSVVVALDSNTQRDRYLAAGADHCVEGEDELKLTVAVLARTRRPAGSIPPLHTLELLGRMTSAVVHDFNNYIGVLQVMLALLRRRPDDADLWAQADAAVDAIRRLDETLLEYARGGAPERTPVDLAAVVRDTLLVAGRLVPSNVSLAFELASDMRSVLAVRTDLEQLVLNLVINACDAMPGGGELRIAVKPVPYGALLEVSDSGRGDVPLPAKRGSTGLGLGIVHAVVERHRGAIRFVPRPEGGTLVAVMLPRAPS
jgi:signal transduction histidine kinase